MGGQGRDDPLALDREAMRQLGYRTIDLLVEQLEREDPPLRRARPEEMRERLHGAPPAVDGQPARELARGDFFGELRAVGSGAGYAYPRLASVRATSALRLLVFPEGALVELVERYPPLDRVIREAVAERLQHPR